MDKNGVKSYKCILIFVACFAIIIATVLTCFFQYYSLPLHTEYYQELGLRGHYTYNDLIERVGEPLETQFEDESIHCIYDGYSVRLESSTASWAGGYLAVFDEKYRFGNQSIGVGSTRKQVERAYKKAVLSLECQLGKYEPNIVEYYYDEIFVRFTFDSDDAVKLIEVFRL